MNFADVALGVPLATPTFNYEAERLTKRVGILFSQLVDLNSENIPGKKELSSMRMSLGQISRKSLGQITTLSTKNQNLSFTLYFSGAVQEGDFSRSRAGAAFDPTQTALILAARCPHGPTPDDIASAAAGLALLGPSQNHSRILVPFVPVLLPQQQLPDVVSMLTEACRCPEQGPRILSALLCKGFPEKRLGSLLTEILSPRRLLALASACPDGSNCTSALIAVAVGLALNQLAAARGPSGVVARSDIKTVHTISQNQVVPVIQKLFAQAGSSSLPFRARPHMKSSTGDLVYAPTLGLYSVATMEQNPQLVDTYLASVQTALNAEYGDEGVDFDITAAEVCKLARSFDGDSKHGFAILQTTLHWPYNRKGQSRVAKPVERPHAISAGVAVRILLGEPGQFSGSLLDLLEVFPRDTFVQAAKVGLAQRDMTAPFDVFQRLEADLSSFEQKVKEVATQTSAKRKHDNTQTETETEVKKVASATVSDDEFTRCYLEFDDACDAAAAKAERESAAHDDACVAATEKAERTSIEATHVAF